MARVSFSHILPRPLTNNAIVWADNADAVSSMYSGTGALKTDFTRTGKRTKMGALQDGVNSVVRYWKNNFMDGARQDAFELVLGNYRVYPARKSPFLARNSFADLFVEGQNNVKLIVVCFYGPHLYSWMYMLIFACWFTIAPLNSPRGSLVPGYEPHSPPTYPLTTAPEHIFLYCSHSSCPSSYYSLWNRVCEPASSHGNGRSEASSYAARWWRPRHDGNDESCQGVRPYWKGGLSRRSVRILPCQHFWTVGCISFVSSH